MSELLIKRVWIEKPECTASTLCVPEAPGLIECDEADGVSVLENQLQRTQAELKLLLEAAGVCPVAAFYIETADGRVLNAEDEVVARAVQTGEYRWA